MDELTFTLNSPITDEQWDAIADVDFDYVESFYFTTKHGKKVEFVKKQHGFWYKPKEFSGKSYRRICSSCQDVAYYCGIGNYRYCPNCGARMESD